MELKLIKQRAFNGITMRVYQDENNEILFTRQQIGEALEYTHPIDAITKIHSRHFNRLDKFSVTDKVEGTDGKMYLSYLYTSKGAMEICRWSQQKKADEFMDFVWDIVDSYRTGKLVPKEAETKPNQAVQEYLALSEEERAIAFFTQKLENKKLEETNKTMLPKVDMYESFMDAHNNKTMKEVANSLFNGKGRNKLFKFLRDCKVLTSGNLPYQQYIDRGYFEVKQNPIKMGEKVTNITQTFVTPKGTEYITKLCKDNGFVTV